ncbi:MAG: ABC transporter ATP-binding protein [Candidatus Rokubacteria bacterium]|nr:ABC transporter ATP-binding protein [Candidatus Rokubacteria bacterium]
MILEARDLYTAYGLSQVLFGVAVTVDVGQAVCLLGRNGVGKTTTLRSLIGLTPPRAGHVVFDGMDITGWAPYRVARQGIAFVPQERRLFGDLSVRENLEVARRGTRGASAWGVERVYETFPILEQLDARRAGYLSGGEQQMLAIGRALMGNPRLLILDEPSEGLAPLVVDALCEHIRALKADGMTILMAEQNLTLALALSERVYILDKGHVRFAGTVAEFEADTTLRDEYLAV